MFYVHHFLLIQQLSILANNKVDRLFIFVYLLFQHTILMGAEKAVYTYIQSGAFKMKEVLAGCVL